MREVKPKDIKSQLNKCYLDYDPYWPASTSSIRADQFKEYVRKTGGILLDFKPEVDRYNRAGYGITNIAIENEQMYTMWLLRWS